MTKPIDVRAVAANLCATADLGREGLEGIPPPPKRFEALYAGADLGVTSRTKRAARNPGLKVDLRVSEAA